MGTETTASPQRAEKIGISFLSKIIFLASDSLIRYFIYFLIPTIKSQKMSKSLRRINAKTSVDRSVNQFALINQTLCANISSDQKELTGNRVKPEIPV